LVKNGVENDESAGNQLPDGLVEADWVLITNNLEQPISPIKQYRCLPS
jgi:hypothetical protein